ncbi:MAG: TonB-dependent receptor [Piscirickettsiaceae bacterium]|nr:TonB-dependent receptor [Piscirickettsiaceae bacterium]
MKFKALSLAIAALLSSHAFANDTTLEPIIVNADFRPSEIQTTAISITSISSEEIQQRSAQHLEDILNMAPNVNMSSGGSRSHYFQIRGIGERSQFSAPINPSVGLIIDDIDFSRSGAAATLFDIEQVEILRGPQGTRFGANALAGVINLRSKEPTNELDIHFESTLAEYDTRSVGIAVGGPLIKDKLLGRFAIHSNKSDGYIDNDFLNRDNTNNRDELTARTSLKWLATDDLTLSLKFLHLDIDNGYDVFSFDNSRTTVSDEPGTDSQKTNAFSLRADWNISTALRLESIISHSSSDLEYSYDEDWSYDGQFDAADWPYSSFDQYLRDRNNNSFEVRLLSNEEGRIFNNSTDWLIGFYHATQDEDLERNYTYDPVFTSKYDTKNTAIFGQFDSALSDKLTLVTGLRVEYWQAKYNDSESLNINSNDTLFGGKLGLNYQVNDDQMLYSSLSRGYKAGGVNTDGTLPENARDFDTEYLWNIEAGIKSLWLDGTLKTNLAVFYAKRKDQQVSSSLLTVRPDNSTEFIGYLTNAAKGKNMGIEAEVDWLVNANWRLFANIGLLRATFDEYNDPDGLDVSGRRQAHAPNYQFAAGTEIYIGQNWTVRANLEGKDEFYFSDRHNAKSNSYALVNASIEYAMESWRLNLWGRNLFDKDYAVRGFGSFGNNPSKSYITETYTQQGEPRIVGVSLSYDY